MDRMLGMPPAKASGGAKADARASVEAEAAAGGMQLPTWGRGGSKM